MSSVALGGIVFLCLFGAALIGMVLRSRLPDHHLSVEFERLNQARDGSCGHLVGAGAGPAGCVR